MGAYNYRTPRGYGDTFFMNAYDGDMLVSGQTYNNQKISVQDGEFAFRFWGGLNTIARSIQIRNRIQRPLNSGDQGAQMSAFASVPQIPEEWYPNDGYVGFDLFNAQPTVVGQDNNGNNVFGSQLVFAGIRRRQGVSSDPMESNYKYYEKPYSYAYSLTINEYAQVSGVATSPVFNQLVITDGYDFVLQRIRVVNATTGALQTTPTFKIWLQNGNKEFISNVPILSTNLINFPIQQGGPQQRNYFPTPQIMYRANSAIVFYITSLLCQSTGVSLPQTYDLEFMGIRRYPCR